MERQKLTPSIATNLDLNRCYTVTSTKKVDARGTVAAMEGHNVLVRGTMPNNRKTVTTILKLSTKGVRRMLTSQDNMVVTGCGYPKRVIVAK